MHSTLFDSITIIDFFNYNSDNEIADSYLDNLFDLGVMPLLTKSTPITDDTKTLIDHKYPNMPHKMAIHIRHMFGRCH